MSLSKWCRPATIAMVITCVCSCLYAQSDSIRNPLHLSGDLRFRAEHDWDSRKANGTFRDDRTRMRVRMRLGMTYDVNDWLTFGGGIRTGDPRNQQDPNITFGLSTGEFSPFTIGIDKAYARMHGKTLSAWFGKNSFPFTRQNELFWSSSVNPEGIAFQFARTYDDGLINELTFSGGHFIADARGKTLGRDGYLQGIQISTTLGGRIKLFPGIFLFRHLGNIPDGQETFRLNYSIIHFGGHVRIMQQPSIVLGGDYYLNVEDYTDRPLIDPEFRDERSGLSLNVKVGSLEQRGDWTFHLYFAHLERYAIVDYFAQNDWARWDYSGFDARAARLSNMKGVEVRIGYALDPGISLVFRAYRAAQIVPTGTHKETGSRARIDLNVVF